MLKKSVIIPMLIFLISGCSNTKEAAKMVGEKPVISEYTEDPHSFSRPWEAAVTHLSLDLTVDFEKKTLDGKVSLKIKTKEDVRQLYLDTGDLSINSVTLGTGETPTEFRLGEKVDLLGQALIIDILPRTSIVNIYYSTSPKSGGLDWVSPVQTAGGKHPFLYTQSQPIFARTWIPLQDSPGVRITYDAKIKVPPELMAVMSAENPTEINAAGVYNFNMPQAIPSYLLALAVGNLEFRATGPRTGIYAEPELAEAAAFEFGETEEMILTAERIYGPYRWGRYDVIVLPPSFPWGGMENPRLTFLTPTVLVGDRSLVALIAHELAHSWSGNLVTNATWRDGWLNEGVTSYLEARLMEIIYDNDRVDEERVIGYEELLLNFDDVPIEQQPLAPRFDTGDPDDFQGTIAYHKGQLFLQFLENEFGREKFDSFLAAYFDTFAFQTITTEEFMDYLDANLLQPQPDIVSRQQVEQWMYEPGLPDDAPIPRSSTLEGAAASARAWALGEAEFQDIPVADWSPQAMVHFLNSLPADLGSDRLRELDEALRLSDTRNAEIGRTWFIQVAQRRYEPAYAKMQEHLNRFGRTRLVRPVYQAMAENGQDLELAMSMFAAARSKYHPITVAAISRVLVSTDE